MGRRVERRQRAHLVALRDQHVADLHQRGLEGVARRLQMGRGVAGVRGGAQQLAAGGGQAALELEHEEEVGELRLAVGRPLAVAALALQVVEVDAAGRCPMGAARESVTTRAPRVATSSGNSLPVSAKWPRWLVANCISKPSSLTCLGVVAITPALLISRSIRWWSVATRSAKRCTEASDARSSGTNSSRAPVTARWISLVAAAALSALRQASTTLRPRAPVRVPRSGRSRCWSRSRSRCARSGRGCRLPSTSPWLRLDDLPERVLDHDSLAAERPDVAAADLQALSADARPGQGPFRDAAIPATKCEPSP